MPHHRGGTLRDVAGEIYGGLRDLESFNQVRIDAEGATLVWRNGVDFDPTLHDWESNGAGILGTCAAPGGGGS